ncbi:MAG: NAD(P)H-dependent oxidoreductase subunit E [Candidatus Brocadiae bacterium]|nr:NAD(P)H-dependent oxidoreductase subunit E [Candidatus Brocadiia bacterium]
MSFSFTPERRAKLDALILRYPKKQAALLPALRLAEEQAGCIDFDAMVHIAEILDVSPARVLGVFSFYTHYRRPGTGKYLVQVCSTLPCALRGSDAVYDALSSELGIGRDETTKDGMFTLKKVECLASCGTAVCLQVNDDYIENVRPEQVPEILRKLRGGA